MAVEVYEFAVTVATGSTPAAPVITNMNLGPRTVDWIEVVVPPGPQGQVGFGLGAAGSIFLPRNAAGYIVTNNEKLHFDVTDQITSGAWQLIAYNQGQYPHTLRVRFGVRLVAAPVSTLGRSLFPAGALSQN